MKRVGWLVLIAALVPVAASAQDPAMVKNPVTSTIKQQVHRYSGLEVGAARLMPANKYDFKASPGERTFGALALHITQFNNAVCSRFTSESAPNIKGLTNNSAKDKLVNAMKASFDYCTKALEPLDDSNMGKPMGKLGPFNLTKGSALVILAMDWADHYGTQAVYLRLNGIEPPSARRRPMARKMGKMGGM